ncbi:MAG: hypothetical protein FJ148_15160 [Deltaproteobacteria bacterium]|nr:hypothetical protein [Deltaproteobacteria bacterium]
MRGCLAWRSRSSAGSARRTRRTRSRRHRTRSSAHRMAGPRSRGPSRMRGASPPLPAMGLLRAPEADRAASCRSPSAIRRA